MRGNHDESKELMFAYKDYYNVDSVRSSILDILGEKLYFSYPIISDTLNCNLILY